ncbi:MAG TPA: cell division protein FtsA [Crocinitomicaceae bacterium]|nr:cell division protein FtsA [Crocinitomicaceae bacterium]
MSIVVGLDIGTTKIACFVGVKNEHGKIEIISMGQSDSLGVARGMVENIDKTVASIQKAVAIAQEKVSDKRIEFVFAGIAGQHINSLQHRGMLTRDNLDTEVTQAEVDRLIEDMSRLAMPPGQEIIDVIPQEYIIDGVKGIYDPIGCPGARLEGNFHVITGHVQAGKNITRCIDRSGLSAKDIILEPLASSAAVLMDDEKEGGVALVDIGGGTTDIAIFADGVIRHTAVIPLAGNIITEDIKNGCSILKSHAEKLKVQFGSALANETQDNEIVCIPSFKGTAPKEINVKNLARIIQARMEEIFECVALEIKKSGYNNKLHAGIVLTGGGAQLKHIAQLCEYVTGTDTRIGYPNEHLASTNTIENITSPIYSTGIGLVLMGFEREERAKKSEPFVENIIEDVVEETPEEKLGQERVGKIRNHSKGSQRGNFFGKIKEKFEGAGAAFGRLFEDE